MTATERRAADAQDGRRTAVIGLGLALALVAVAVTRLLLFGWAEVAPDDARYVFVGLSTLDGHGPLTPSGTVFLLRSPIYGILLAIGSVITGDGPLAGARIVAALLTMGGLVGAVRLGWLLAGPMAAAATALVLLATPLMWTLLPTLRIDLPQTAGVIAVILALRRPTLARWLLAGALFGLTALVKETILLLALAPLAFAGEVPLLRLARLWAGFLGTAAVVAGWWWIVVWTQSGTIFPLNAIGVIESRDVGTALNLNIHAVALLGLFAVAWIVVVDQARHEPRLRILVAAALALVPPTVYAVLSGLNARNDAGLAVLSAVATGVATARLVRWSARRSRRLGRADLDRPTRAASLGAIAVAVCLAGLGQARANAPTESGLPAMIVDSLRADTPPGGRVVMTFRDAEVVALELYGRASVPSLAAVRVDSGMPLDGYLWIGLRDRQLFGYLRTRWANAMSAPGTADLVLAGPHPLTPVELTPSLDRGRLPGLVLGRRLAADGDWASIYRVDPAAVRVDPGDVPLHLSAAAAVAWLDLAEGADPSAAVRRLAASGAIVVGAGMELLERRLAGTACLIPIPDLAPDARRIAPTGPGCNGS